MKFILSASAFAAAVTASALGPVSYAMPNGQGQGVGGSYNYWDETYTGTGSTNADLSPLSGGLGQLTDGVVGGTDWSSDLGHGPAYEWVGWYNVDPTITFDYGSLVSLTSLDLFTNNYGFGGVALWDSIDFTFSNNGTTFSGLQTRTATSAERADSTARYLSASLGGVNARYVRMTIHRYQNNWAFISEIRTNAAPVPEPAPVAALALGGLAFLRRRRR